MRMDGQMDGTRDPYRTPPSVTDPERPWPLGWLVLGGLLAWSIVVHGLGSLAGRW